MIIVDVFQRVVGCSKRRVIFFVPPLLPSVHQTSFAFAINQDDGQDYVERGEESWIKREHCHHLHLATLTPSDREQR